MFAKFRLDDGTKSYVETTGTEAAMGALVNELAAEVASTTPDNDPWIAQAVADGRVGALPHKVRKRMGKIMEEYKTLATIFRDNGRTLVW